MFSVNNMRQPQILHFDEGADIFKKQPTIASEWKQRASTTFSSVFTIMKCNLQAKTLSIFFRTKFNWNARV